MLTIQQNEASAAERRIFFGMVDASALTPKEDINFSTSAIFVSKNGGTPTTAAGSAFEIAPPVSGVYYYQPSANEVDTPGTLTIQLFHVSCLPQWPTVQIVRAVNVSSGVIEAKIVEISAGAIGVVSANVVAMSAGVIGSTTIAASAITSTRIDGNVNANVVLMSAGVIGSTTIAASAITTTRFNDHVPANTLQVASVKVSGVGTSANPWRPG
jgi:hypothetical protein